MNEAPANKRMQWTKSVSAAGPAAFAADRGVIQSASNDS